MLTYYKEIVIFAKKLLHNKEYALDVVQEAYLRMIQAEKTMEIKHPKAYLYKTARNIIIDDFRKSKEHHNTPYEEGSLCIPKEEEPHAIVMHESQQKHLLKILDTFPKKAKQALVLYLIEGHSKTQIAQRMNATKETTEKLITRGLLKLKEALKEEPL
jgi:RNA polymerase sigma-70 factor, ECF subfamily